MDKIFLQVGRFLTLTIVLLVAVLFAPPAVRGQSPVETVTGQKFAFLVGISEYEMFCKLQYPANDVSTFKDQPIESGFAPHNITVLASGARIAMRPSKR